MNTLEIGQLAPDFNAITDDKGNVNLADYTGKKILLYFYPKDNTPGCTIQATDFTTKIQEFLDTNTVIIGVSKDSCKSHGKFRDKHNLKITLISDEKGELCEKYGVFAEKSIFGKTSLGIIRSSFLIDEKGKILNIWKKVSAKGHADEVLDFIKKL